MDCGRGGRGGRRGVVGAAVPFADGCRSCRGNVDARLAGQVGVALELALAVFFSNLGFNGLEEGLEMEQQIGLLDTEVPVEEEQELLLHEVDLSDVKEAVGMAGPVSV